LGIGVSKSSVKRILNEAGIYPDPERKHKSLSPSWSEFVHAHVDTLVACDFFTKPVLGLVGWKEAYVLVFIHVGTRKVFVSPPTYSPTHDWVKQQNRNAIIWLDEIGVEPEFLIRDGDQKFPVEWLEEAWGSEGARVIRIPPKSPKANAFCESFIGHLKRECLNRFVCFGLDHFHYILRTWIGYYNTRRPHRGIGKNNEVLDEDFKVETIGEIKCREKLGGFIKDYYRDAA